MIKPPIKNVVENLLENAILLYFLNIFEGEVKKGRDKKRIRILEGSTFTMR